MTFIWARNTSPWINTPRSSHYYQVNLFLNFYPFKCSYQRDMYILQAATNETKFLLKSHESERSKDFNMNHFLRIWPVFRVMANSLTQIIGANRRV